MTELFLYMIRWQLSTPILAVVPIVLKKWDIKNYWVVACVANLIGSLIFYWVDKWIFR